MESVDLLESLSRLVDELRDDQPPEALPMVIDLADDLVALVIAPRSDADEMAAGLMTLDLEGGA